MNKILGIVGSPRKKGNTFELVSKILEGSKLKGADTNIIYLEDLDINECNGCHTCWQGLECSKKDDMNEIYPELIEADVIIFGTPVYWFGPTALMKAFIDRFVYFNCPENRTKIKGTKAIIVIPFEDDNFETATPLEMMFEKSFEYLEINLINKIIVPGVGKKGDVLKKSNVLENCFNIGQRII
ncbi:MAG: flavodoxin family protein [Candidatus Lokiarchaeota archaeon]|nr:flavodoxin family protein [Candidatus Lokiarchaeota archaeon]